jgi:adenylate cyclase
MTKRQTAAILFADVAGSSRLYKSLGDDRAEAMINAVVTEMSEVTVAHGGTVIKTIGDEVMASFETAEAAVRAAVAIQQRRRESEPRIEARLGTHYGPTLVRNGDVFGEAVNDAAYLVRIARAGQIITSADTVLELPEELKARAYPFDRVPMKGAREPTMIYLVSWEELVDGDAIPVFSTQVLAAITDADAGTGPTLLEIEYQGRRLSVGPEDLPFIVGRDPTVATLAVRTEVASRDHFHIDYRRGKFVLQDNSTNGTWVQLDGQEAPVYLRREETPLTGGGTIAVGRAISEGDPHLIRFRA